jgi:PAS domain S-box-containing protein
METGKDSHSARIIQKKILIPLVCFLLFIILAFSMILVIFQNNALKQSSLKTLNTAANGMFKTIENQSQMLIALQNVVLCDAGISRNLQEQDRQILFANYTETFIRLKKDYNITHFYFHLPDRVNLLRIHKKEKFGDIIDRYTMLDSFRTGKPSSGIELGPLGTFTLRVVQPVFLNNEIVGYIEFGKEIANILAGIHKKQGIEIACSIRKDWLVRSEWEKGMAMLGRKANWDRLPKKVLMYTSFADFPEQLEYFITDGGHEHDKISSIIKYGDQSWHALASEIVDASGTEVGDMVIFVDISTILSQYISFTAMIAGTAFIILIIILSLIFKVVRHTDSMIFEQQQSVEKSERRFRSLFNSINDLIYTQDMDGYFTSANPAMHKLFGYDMDEFIGLQPSNFMEPKFQEDFDKKYLDAIREQGYLEGISSYFKKNREKIYIEYKSSLVTPKDGKPYISGMGRDVTEKIVSERKVKNLQMQIMQVQKMEAIGTLAGGIAHDFNNILFPIMGHTEMLLADFPEDTHTYKSLNKIYSGALRARDLVKQILDFSRQESGKTQLVTIHPVIKEALKLMKSSIPSGIKIIQDIDNNVSSIKADPTKLHQIIMNLVTNACYAMEEIGGELNISLKEVKLDQTDLVNPDMYQGVYARLVVSDTGTGINNDILENIFDPFFTTKEKAKGTGMGLSVVHGIVVGIGGGIKVETQEGKGTKFNVYLPVVKSRHEIMISPDTATLTGGSEHILLVDDVEAIVIMGKEMLERLGYKVTTRTSSIEALKLFQAVPDRFDLVITDLSMPNMAGDKLAEKLIQLSPDVPILLCTGFGEIMTKEQAIAIGIRDFLLKPVRINDFAHKIRQVLDY